MKIETMEQFNKYLLFKNIKDLGIIKWGSQNKINSYEIQFGKDDTIKITKDIYIILSNKYFKEG